MTANTKHRVLIVDDDTSIRELIAMVVASGGHEPVCAPCVADALAELERAPSTS